ncbi:tRNA pseudouridine(38-40) synthase TruA [bacterium]|nr:tRNA pseudouridine(38-40) synthase TruA [bacterium]
MRNIVLGVSYDGTDFAGFQKQKSLPTIQGEIEEKLANCLGERVRVIAASRTDAGVHAKGQVINFLTSSPIPVEKFPRILNDRLPSSIRVIWSKEMDASFHSRFDAKSRIYKYFLINKAVISPFLSRYALVIPEELDLELMRKAGKMLEGVHNFSAFTSERTKTRRHLIRLDIKKKHDIIIFTLEANAFLKGMVRNIVGLLLQIGRGKYSPSIVEECLEGKKSVLNLTVAPQGLFLWKVKYDEF